MKGVMGVVGDGENISLYVMGGWIFNVWPPICPFLFYNFSFKFVYTFPLFVYSRSTYLVFKLLIYFKTPSDQLYTFQYMTLFHYYIVLSPAYDWVVTSFEERGLQESW